MQVSCNFTQSLRAFSEECALILPLYTIARKRKARFCVHDGLHVRVSALVTFPLLFFSIALCKFPEREHKKDELVLVGCTRTDCFVSLLSQK